MLRGRARFSWGPGGAASAEVGPRDFLAVAPHAIHREEALGDEEFCNAHHLRELTFVEEQRGQGWAADLKGLGLQIKQAVDDARGQGLPELPADAKREFERRYDVILEQGLQANRPPPPTGQRGRPKRGQAGSLVSFLVTASPSLDLARARLVSAHHGRGLLERESAPGVFQLDKRPRHAPQFLGQAIGLHR